MIFRQKDKKKNIVLLAGLVVFCVLFVLKFFFATAFSTLFESIARPFWNLRESISRDVPDIFGAFSSKNSLVSENQSLQNDNEELRVQNLELSAELQALSSPDLLALIKKPSLIKAKVLAAPPYVPFDYLHIDSGARAGIVLGDQAYVGDNIVIGHVSQVSTNYATVILFSSPSYASSATILRTGETIALSGQGGGTFSISLPKDTDIRVGDMLTDSSAAQSVMAQVYSVDTMTDGSFKKVLARVPVNISATQWVGISPQVLP